jgi:hypothetical protein
MRITNVAEVTAPGPEGLSGQLAQWAGQRPAPSQRFDAALTPPSNPAAKQSPQAAARRQPRIQRMSSERWRMASSLLLSLLIHTLLLSLTFGGHGLGLPGFGFPWRDRRIEAPELRVVLVPAPITPAEPAVKSVAGPAQQASIEPPVAGRRAPTPPASPAPPLGGAAVVILPATKPKAEVKPERNAVTRAAPAKTPMRAGEPGHAAPAKIPKPAATDVKPSGRRTLVAPAAPTAPSSRIEVAPSASIPETVMSVPRDGRERIGQDVRERAAEFAKQADRLKAARVEAAKPEAARQEEAARAAKRLEAERQEATRLAAAQLEAQRQEAARQEEAARAAKRLEAERQEATRLAAAQLEAARVRTEQEEAARREAVLRSIGRQLDEEAARREELPLSLSSARRGRLWGRTDPNVELIRYAEAWAQKIHFNTPVDTIREVAKRPHTNPMVTVAIRSDGSVESVTFVLSSGVAEVDEAIRRIVQSHEHYQAFSPALAREYDVVEIRRTWHFDDAVRLY